jgi:hypothetical protein
LPNGYFQDKGWDSDKEDGQKIWYEPLKTVVIVKNTGISEQVSLSRTATHSSEEKGCSGGPLITTILALRSRGR